VVEGTLDSTGQACSGGAVVVDGNGYANITVAGGGATVPAVAIYTGQRVAGGATCDVTFIIGRAGTAFGQNLYVTGNQTSLGNWTPGSGFALTIHGTGADAPWSGTVTLPAGTLVQYKYVKWDGAHAAWESDQASGSGNREFMTCTSGAQARGDGKFGR
jgi:alpha-amylase